MRYINKEFGFAFRPPFYDKFYEENVSGPELTGENFPQRYIQGVGYDYSAINGAMLVGKNGTMWGIKVCYFNGKKWLDNDDFVNKLSSACANTMDSSFAHFASGAISVKWVKHNEQSIILQVSARKKLRVRVIFYPCFGLAGELSIEGGCVQGRCPYMGIIPGNITLSDNNAVFSGRYLVVGDEKDDREYFMAQSYNKPSDSANGAFNEAIMEFVINKNQPSIYIYASVGDENIFESEIPKLDKIESQIMAAELMYGVNKTMGTGALGASAERMLNSILWSRIYYPYLLTEIYSPQRSMLNNNFDIRGLEENCSAMLGALTGIDKATKQLTYTLEDKVMAVLAVWHIYSHATEKSDILYMYKKLAKLYPPSSKPVIAGEDKNEVAYKWDDSPLKEKNITLDMYSLDMTSLKLLAIDILERICMMFDLQEGSSYTKAKKELIAFINDNLWNEKEGLYLNRYVTGRWAENDNYGATSFYPLIAGAVDSGEKLTALINNLTSVNKFWGDYIVPTLSVNNKEYAAKSKPNNNGHRSPPFLEYRGSIVPYVNYIIYHGLCRYGLDEISAQFALKSANLWVNNESDNVENYSVYLPSGKRYKSKEYLSSIGNMLAMIGIEELLDLEYFRNDMKTGAIKFGTFITGDNSLSNFKMLGKVYSIDINDMSTMLIIDNVNVFKGEGGKFVVRNFIDTTSGCEFMIDAHAKITINLNLPSPNKKTTTKYFVIVPQGKSKVLAENGMVSVNPIKNNL